MLCELRISNFAIIEEQSILFGGGLNVISGETGTGKSIVLQALEMILGDRPRPQYLRAGTEGWEIEGLFNLGDLPAGVMEELPDLARSEELVVHRSMSAGGKSKVYINGRLATAALLEEISSRIINICRQGQQNRLANPRYHLELIDGFSGNAAELEGYRRCYARWRSLEEEIRRLEKSMQSAALRREELMQISDELGKIELRTGLREELDSEVRKLGNAEALLQKGGLLSSEISGERGPLGQLKSLGVYMNELCKLDPGLGDADQLFRSARTSLEEFLRALERYLRSLQVDEERLELIREKLAEIARVERKYRRDCAGLIGLLEDTRRELSLIEDGGVPQSLREELSRTGEEVFRRGKELSELREKAARALVKAVEKDLRELNMPDARLKIENGRVEPGPDGIDKVQILIAPNKGEGLKGLSQIASGGELSRIMLVLKKVLRERSGVNVLVFDEVDAGISGAVARAVGEKLKDLARQSQVLCITHLAQVASLADHHFIVEKLVKDRTVSQIRELKEAEKVD